MILAMRMLESTDWMNLVVCYAMDGPQTQITWVGLDEQ